MKRQLITIAALTLAGQVAAFVKLWVTAHVFGVGATVDGYNLALVLPILLSSSVSGILQTGLFPVRGRIAARNQQGDTDAFERAVLLGVFLLGIVLSLVLVASRDLATHWIAGEAPEATKHSFSAAFLPLVSLLALNVVGDCTGYVLAMRNRYSIAAAAPLANGLVGALILVSFSDLGLTALVWSTVVGVAVQVAICIAGLRLVRLKLLGGLPSSKTFMTAIVEMSKLGVWMVPGVILSNLVLSLPQIWITQFGEGAVSAFGYALRLHLAALQLIIMASSTLLLARFAELVARHQTRSVSKLMRTAIVASLVLGLIGFLSVFLLGEVVLNLILGGNFTPDAARRVTMHWIIISAALPCTIMSNVYAKLWQAQGKPFLMTLLSLVNLVVMQIVFWFTQDMFQEYCGAVALTAGATVSAFLAIAVERFRKHQDRSVQVTN